MLAAAVLLAACATAPSTGPTGTPGPDASATASRTPAGSETPTATAVVSPGPTDLPNATPGVPTAPPGSQEAGCSGSDAHRLFFVEAAAAMSWPVYCAVLPDGWFLEDGKYRQADGGRLDVTYRGPGDARLSLAEGNVCGGADVEACAPRDAVIGPAAFGDQEGELGRLANGLVLDVDRGANPSWRATGLGLSEEAFRAICAALVLAEG